MTDPTIPELVARLRELHAKLQALQVGTPEFTAARQLFRDVLQLSAPAILDALICSAIFAERARHAEEVARLRDVHLDETRALDDLRLKEIASLRDQLRKVEGERDEAVAHRLNVATDGVSDPWRPIEECGELEVGEYLVRMKRGELAEFQYLLITIARWSGAEWQVRIGDAERYYYRAEHITHVHRMGPIRGPGEGER